VATCTRALGTTAKHAGQPLLFSPLHSLTTQCVWVEETVTDDFLGHSKQGTT
jgi:hypothetical protein